jgi:hypothetical protein
MSKPKTPKVIDLEPCSDGSYAQANTKSKAHHKTKGGLIKTPIGEKPKYIRENHADEFLRGVDAGLDFLDSIVPRVERLFKLRG